jgi:hypothetical protein
MDALSAASALLPDLRVKAEETLGRSERSEVLRVRVDGPDWAGPPKLIVKLYPDAGESWARESAALAAMPAAAPVPRLIAASADPPALVMTDAGTGPSLATALLGRDPAQATAATAQFAESLAALHLATQDAHHAFAAELAARSAGTVPPALMPALVTSAAAALDRYCAQLGVTVAPGSLAELEDLPARLAGSGPSALTLADACPDNNVRTTRGYLLIDFEEAEWRPVAWDVAYLTVPRPPAGCATWARPRSSGTSRWPPQGGRWSPRPGSWAVPSARTSRSTAGSRRSTRPAGCRRSGRSSPTAWRPRSAPKVCPGWPASRADSAQP